MIFDAKKQYSLWVMQQSATMLGLLLAYTLYLNIVKNIDMEEYVLSPPSLFWLLISKKETRHIITDT
jgi:hypothetical protein